MPRSAVPLGELEQGCEEVRDQAQRQVGVADRRTEGPAGGPLHVVVCPMPILDGTSEGIDTVLLRATFRAPAGRLVKTPRWS